MANNNYSHFPLPLKSNDSKLVKNIMQNQQQQTPTSALQQYRELIVDCQKIQGKISELEVDRAEHVLVEETLKPLDPKRRAFRLVGECLVERTVEEVLPTVAANRENMEKTISALRERLENQQTQATELKTKYNLAD